MSGLLMNERFVAVFPSLVRLLGSMEAAVILQHLHWSADENGDIKITRQQISDETGVHFASVTRRLKRLRDDGWITSQRSSTSDSTQVYQVCHERLADCDVRELQIATPESGNLAGSESRNLQLSSTQKVRTTKSAVSTGSKKVDPERHPSRPIDTDWQPSDAFRDYLWMAYPHTDVEFSLNRFVLFYYAKQETSKSWEAKLELWVSNDNDRAAREVLEGTDELGTPRTQRKSDTSALQPGDPGYFDARAYLDEPEV